MRKLINSLVPAVKKIWLQVISGLIWSAIGMLLVYFASRWLMLLTFGVDILLIIGGCLLGSLIFYFGFSKLARKNIKRIESYQNNKVCLFAFQEWKSYPLVAFMIALGVYLRVYSHFPGWFLAILYIGIGSAMFASSLIYYVSIHTSRHPRQDTI